MNMRHSSSILSIIPIGKVFIADKVVIKQHNVNKLNYLIGIQILFFK